MPTTVASLIAEIAADTTRYTAGLQKAEAATRKFSSDISKSLANVKFVDEQKLARTGETIARRLTSTLNARFLSDSATFREQLARGLISESAFRNAGNDAARAANAAIIEQIDKLRAAGSLTEPIRRALVAQMRDVGADAGEAFTRSFADKMRDLAKTANGLGRTMQDVGRTLAASITAPIVGLGVASFKVAADAAESASKMEAIFGDATAGMNKSLQSLTASIPQTLAQLQDAVGDTYSLIAGFGAAPKAAGAFSAAVVRLAGDIASLRNIRFSEALTAIQAGLRGESEPVARFGADVRVAALEVEGLKSGLIKQGETLSAVGRAQAAFNILVKAQSFALGDAARTADSSANTVRFLQRDLRDAAETIGRSLLPVITPLIRDLSRLTQQVSMLSPGTVRMALGIAGVAAVVGPLVIVLGSLARTVGLVATAFRLAASSTGIVAFAAGVGALGAVLTGGAIIAGLVALAIYLKRSGDAASASAEQVANYQAKLQRFTQQQLVANSVVLTEEVNRIEAERDRLQNLLNPRKVALPVLRLLKPDAAAQIDEVVARLDRTRTALQLTNEQFQRGRESADEMARALEELKKQTGNALGVTGIDKDANKSGLERMAAQADKVADAIGHIRDAFAPTNAQLRTVLATFDTIAVAAGGITDVTAKGASQLIDAFARLAKDPVVQFFRTDQKAAELALSVKLTDGSENEIRERVARLFKSVNLGDRFAGEAFTVADRRMKALGATLQATLNDAVLGLRIAPKVKAEIDTSGVSGQFRSLALNLAQAGDATRKLVKATGPLAPFAGIITRAAKGLDVLSGVASKIAVSFATPLAGLRTVIGGFGSAMSLATRGLIATASGIARSIASALNPLNVFATFAGKIGEALSPALNALEGPLSSLATVVADGLTPVFNALRPVVDALVPVIRELFNIVGPILVALAPVLKVFVTLLNAVLPIIRLAAIAFTYLGQVVLTIAGALTRFFGNLVIGFGYVIEVISRAVDKLPFVSAKGAIAFAEGIQKMGRDMLGMADEFKAGSDALGVARDQIQSGAYAAIASGSAAAADSLNDVAEKARAVTAELTNVPTGFRIANARFLATLPRIVSNGGTDAPRPLRPPTSPTGGGGPVVNLYGDILIAPTAGQSPLEMLVDIVAQSETAARTTYGNSTAYPRTLPAVARAMLQRHKLSGGF